jgi:hypothetical protein
MCREFLIDFNQTTGGETSCGRKMKLRLQKLLELGNSNLSDLNFIERSTFLDTLQLNNRKVSNLFPFQEKRIICIKKSKK